MLRAKASKMLSDSNLQYNKGNIINQDSELLLKEPPVQRKPS